MIEEQHYGIEFEPTYETYDAYIAQHVDIEVDTIEELKHCFVGFSVSPIGVFNHHTYEIQTMKFNNLDEIEIFIKSEHDAGKEMILLYLTKELLRFAYA